MSFEVRGRWETPSYFLSICEFLPFNLWRCGRLICKSGDSHCCYFSVCSNLRWSLETDVEGSRYVLSEEFRYPLTISSTVAKVTFAVTATYTTLFVVIYAGSKRVICSISRTMATNTLSRAFTTHAQTL